MGGFSPELSGKQLELLKEVVPNVARVAMLANPTNPHTPFIVREAEMAARALGVQLHLIEVREPNELGSVFAAMTTARANALLVLPDPMLSGQSGRIVELAAQSRLPAMYAELSWALACGLMVYGVSLDDMNRRAATYVDKILKGAQPGDLPVERPVKFKLVINLKTAKALGLTIPPSILFQADEVIQ
jgi:putative ABC transport system substrate-binding protein